MNNITKKILQLVYVPSPVYAASAFLSQIPIYRNSIKLNFFIEVLIFLPLITYLLFELYSEVSRHLEKTLKERMDILFVISITYFLAGMGIHFTGNEINNFLNNSVEIAYLYDEIIGHIVTYSGFLGVITILSIAQILSPSENKISKKEEEILILTGIIFGIFASIAAIEGQAPYFGYLIAPLLSILFLIIIKKNKLLVHQLPTLVFVMTSMISLFISTIVYWIIFQGFPQPSSYL
ncbi:MAG: hypothetical protein ACTSSP_00680 [Candidatus Asgardarchaeia archaeon]